MFAIIYRWRVEPGKEEQFADAWARVTRSIHRSCGSYGSRLHRAEDGTWVAYARWPDAATREACEHPDAEAERLMSDAAAEFLGATPMTVTDDLLAEPAHTDPAA